MTIISKVPTREQIVPVYATIVIMIFPWTLMRFFWKLPSWLFYLSLGEISAIFAYEVVVNLVESLLVLLVPVLMSIILPRNLFHDRFVTRGVSLILLGLGYLIYLNNNIQASATFPVSMVRWIPIVGIAILVLVYLIDRVGFIRKVLEELASRAVVFLYISIPISVISILVVFIRNEY